TPVPGYRRMGHPRVSGSVVGAVGGCAFIVVNTPALDGPWALGLRLLGLAALGLWVWAVLLRPRPLPPHPRPDRTGGIVYFGGLIAMFAIMFIGIRWLEAAGREGLEPAVVALAVGAHFLPYARAFAAPIFLWLGSVMVALGIAGLALGLTSTVVAAPAAAVAAGFVLLIGSAVDALGV
ncbi:MAG: hypothetical protein L0H60_07535, partial [Micrococcaceae bacterium]|nr:hypothetical protein [Micrococcaceae bacterium]